MKISHKLFVMIVCNREHWENVPPGTSEDHIESATVITIVFYFYSRGALQIYKAV